MVVHVSVYVYGFYDVDEKPLYVSGVKEVIQKEPWSPRKNLLMVTIYQPHKQVGYILRSG